MRISARGLVQAKITLLSASVVFALSVSSPVGAVDPATGMLVLTMAESALSMGSNKPDLTFEAIRQQTVMIEAIHRRLDQSEQALSTLLTLVNNLPDHMRDALQEDRDVNRKETLVGWIAVLQSIGTDLAEATRRKDTQSIEQLRQRLRYRIDDFRAERAALFERSDFVLPSMVLALTAEAAALEMLPRTGNEMARELAGYDERLAAALDPDRPESVVATRIALEKLQGEHDARIAKTITGADGNLADGTWPWYSHTLMASREVKHRRPRTYRRVPGCSDCAYDDGGYDTVTEKYPVHSRSWSREVRTTPLPSSEGAGLFVFEVVAIGPTEAAGGLKGATQHWDGDSEYESKFTEAADISAEIAQFNSRANAIDSLRNLEQIAYAARTLIANWDSGQAQRLSEVAKAADTVEVHALVGEADAIAVAEEVRERQDGMEAARKQAWSDIKAAREEFDRAVEKARSEQWRSDLLMGLQIGKLSLQAQELGERIGLLEAGPAVTAAVAKVEDAVAGPAAQEKKQGAGALIDENADIAVAGLTPKQKADTIERIIREVSAAPSAKWRSLPPNPTLEESKITFALTLLDSMGESYSDTLNNSYDIAKADGVTGKIAAMAMSIMPTPIGGDTIVDAPSRREMRVRLNELAAPYAKRRSEDILKSQAN
ncbi:hypothetical protein OIU34_16905 [Pararhizobium sp. BT-229]|uniref:hypothetical protein n=1 Tax=Pararhizobium sp. BT-229 TaxID=2986923 RepID=UPI0021F7A6FA|nr:hypothetical protein [Pararhizobium sp. BT-229]MCV9963585.1 hypothetical protein [Pararhizobium sp. BT-229]